MKIDDLIKNIYRRLVSNELSTRNSTEFITTRKRTYYYDSIFLQIFLNKDPPEWPTDKDFIYANEQRAFNISGSKR